MLVILRADAEPHFEQVRELILELAAWDLAQASRLHLDPKLVAEFFYSVPDELPGAYAPPGGSLFLATHSGKAAGCVAFRSMSSDVCELKRMYVRPGFRGMGIGRRLIDALIQAARQSGYSLMRLETTTAAEGAVSLYRTVGFRPCQPYYAIPDTFREVTIFMEVNLTEGASNPGCL
jgi:putative acetyltransferase